MSDLGKRAEFYASYEGFKSYSVPQLKAKQARLFDRQFWQPADCKDTMSMLELGCGTGLFLSYLDQKGVRDFIGVDADPALADVIPESVSDRFKATSIDEFIEGLEKDRRFDRIIMWDVLEHFEPTDGAALLRRLCQHLPDDGLIAVKVPNVGSPWGLAFQYGDLTHLAAYTPSSMRQLAIASGYDCVACYGEVSGTPRRRLTDPMVHWFLSKMLMRSPEIWSANFFALLRPRAEA
ncbi:MAG: class I SAM-dependent methyltransferase [Proteobacteria bacterium]|nr:class I SAM-dependent methyltransferase [Pseudomonadota bacterium]